MECRIFFLSKTRAFAPASNASGSLSLPFSSFVLPALLAENPVSLNRVALKKQATALGVWTEHGGCLQSVRPEEDVQSA